MTEVRRFSWTQRPLSSGKVSRRLPGRFFPMPLALQISGASAAADAHRSMCNNNADRTSRLYNLIIGSKNQTQTVEIGAEEAEALVIELIWCKANLQSCIIVKRDLRAFHNNFLFF